MMKKRDSLIQTLLALSPALALSAAPAQAVTPIGVAAVVKGRVGKKVGATQAFLREGDKIEEGAIITTSSDGFAKIVLLDQTQLVIGPNASMAMENLRANSPGIVSLLQGTVRSKVVKDPMAPNPAAPPKTKFIFRTKSATMGVRGTDFQVIYNPENKITSLITYEGGVAMVKNPEGSESSTALTRLLSNEKTVLVTEGRFASSLPALADPTIPTRLSPAQFEAMKASDPGALARTSGMTLGSSSSGSSSSGSPIPPGVNPKTFAAAGGVLERQLGNIARNSIIDAPASAGLPPPEGIYDRKNGAYAPPAGGFVDVKTGLYVPPPPGSSFDSNTGVFVPPPSSGGFDAQTGKYLPPPGFQLDPRQGFVPVPGSPGAVQPVSGSQGANRKFDPSRERPRAGFVPNFFDPRAPRPEEMAPQPDGPVILQPLDPNAHDPLCMDCRAPQLSPPPPSTTTNIRFLIHVE